MTWSLGRRGKGHMRTLRASECTAVQRKDGGGPPSNQPRVLASVASKLHAKALLTSIEIMCILRKQLI